MLYIQFLIYIILTVCTAGIVFLIGFMMVSLLAPMLEDYLRARDLKNSVDDTVR